MAGFNVISVDFNHGYVNGKEPELPNQALLNICEYSAERLHFGLFIKTSKIKDKTRDSALSSDSLIKST